MNRKLLAASIAALAAGNVHAAADFNFAIAGATAPTAALGDVIASNICQGNTQVVVSGRSGTSGAWAIECDVNTTSGAARVGFFKSDGGSSQGVAKLDNKTSEDQLGDMDVLTTTDGCTAYNNWADALANKCLTPSQVKRASDVGISDVDPRIFVGALADLGTASNIGTAAGEDPANLRPFNNNNDLQVSDLGSLLFGIVVTEPFYAAMQSSQFEAGSPCHPDTYLAAVASETSWTSAVDTAFDAAPESTSAACMPSLARAEVAAMLSGDIASTKAIASGNSTYGSTTYSDLYNYAYGRPWAGQGSMNLCLRNQGSGTHAVTMQYFLRANCGAVDSQAVRHRQCDGDAAALGDYGRGDNTRTAYDCADVVGNEGSSDMTKCLTQKSAANRWAIGYQSLENNANLADGDYRFVKIDGVVPSLENFLKGDYKEFGNVTMQVRGVDTWTASNGIDGGEAAIAADLFADIVSNFANDASALGTLNTNSKFQHGFGEAGWASQSAGAFIGADVNKLVAGHVAKPVNPLVYKSLNGVRGLCGTPETVFGAVDSLKP